MIHHQQKHGQKNGSKNPDHLLAIALAKIKNTPVFIRIHGCINIDPANENQCPVDHDQLPVDVVEYALFFSQFSFCTTPLIIRSSTSFLLILPVRYFSIISMAIGAAQVAPKPAFSTITEIAILGLFLGAKAIKIL